LTVLSVASGTASKLDPLVGGLATVAKELEPSDDVLAEFTAAMAKAKPDAAGRNWS
jgi:hypothetical protein